MADTQTIHGLDDVLRKLKSLPPQLVSKRGGPVAAALRAGGRVIAKQWQDNIQRIVDEPNVGGLPSESTGLLRKSVAVSRDSKPWRHGANERVMVRIRNRKYPNASGTKPVTTAQVARLLEFGTERMTAKPFAVPGYMSSRQRALDTVVSTLNTRIAAIIRKMEV